MAKARKERTIPKVAAGHVLPVATAAATPRRACAPGGRAGGLRARVSTRKVDDLVKALGVDGISKSEVSRICAELDTTVAAFRMRPLTGEHRHVWTRRHRLRVDGRVISQATPVAVGVTSGGERQVLGVDGAPRREKAFCTAFLRSLVKRGLKGVRLAISDAYEGLTPAISTVLSGTTWQRRRVHFWATCSRRCRTPAREAIAAIVRTIFAQPDHASARAQLRKVGEGLRARSAKAAALLEGGAEDVLAHRHLPLEHQRQRHSSKPAERLNKEIKRQSEVVGISQPGSRQPPDRRRLARTGRRVGRCWAPLLQRRVDVAASGTGPVETAQEIMETLA